MVGNDGRRGRGGKAGGTRGRQQQQQQEEEDTCVCQMNISEAVAVASRPPDAELPSAIMGSAAASPGGRAWSEATPRGQYMAACAAAATKTVFPSRTVAHTPRSAWGTLWGRGDVGARKSTLRRRSANHRKVK